MADTASKDQAPLDELMMAMDVVDTLRHDDALVMRELGAENRDARMIERLREIYSAQGIEVPDHILREGVEGLKHDRFVYAPPASGAARFLALIYISRLLWAKWLAISIVVVIAAFAGWQLLVVGPQQRAAEELRIELAEGIPASLDSISGRILEMTPEAAAIDETGRLVAEGKRFAAAGDAANARKAVSDLTALEAELATSFEVRIVSRPGTPTGVTRIPDVNASARNFYLVVEAIGPSGQPLERSVVSEEDGKSKQVTIWAQRVPEDVFNAVRDDKQKDGIVQDSLLGTKLRGRLAPIWEKAVEEGAITEW